MRKPPSQTLIREARQVCDAVAEGRPYTPVVFERYAHIGGETGYGLGYPTSTEDGRGSVAWTYRATPTNTGA